MLKKIHEAIGKLFVFTKEYRDIKRELHLLDNERKSQLEFTNKLGESIILCRKDIEGLLDKVIEMQANKRADTQLATERKAKRTRKQV